MFVDNLPFLTMWQELSLLYIPPLSGPATQIIPMKECISSSAQGRSWQLDSAGNVTLFETDLQHRFPAWEFIHGEPVLLRKTPWFGCAWVCLEYPQKYGLMKPEWRMRWMPEFYSKGYDFKCIIAYLHFECFKTFGSTRCWIKWLIW